MPAPQTTQTVVLTDGESIRQRRFIGGVWQAWQPAISTDTLGLPGSDPRIRSYSESKRPDGVTKRDLLYYDGTALFSQFLIGGTWNTSEISVGALGIAGVDRLASFDQTYGDVETGGRPRQFAVEAEGKRLHVRTHDGSNWGPWSSLQTASLGISYQDVIGGKNMSMLVSRISSFSQALNPAGLPKQDATTLI